jgi:hydrogenase expression/formation protein HypC
MCLAIPGLLLEVDHTQQLLMGLVDFDGVRKHVVLSYLPEAQPGDYVIVHVGFAISRLAESEAQKTFTYLQELFNHEVSE